MMFVDPSQAKGAEFGAQGLSRHGGHKANSILLASMGQQRIGIREMTGFTNDLGNRRSSASLCNVVC